MAHVIRPTPQSGAVIYAMQSTATMAPATPVTTIRDMIGILATGQSLMRAMSDYQTGACPTPHADTHLWNGTAFATPTGDGMVTYLNALRQAMNQPIYCINAAVNGMGLDPWIATYAAAAITIAQTAIATVSGLAIDRIEFWGMQADGLASAAYQHCRDGLDTLLGIFHTAFPDARFCVWPLGRLASGASQYVVHAQMDFALADPLTREPGSASHDQPTADGTHLTPGGYAVMGTRGAANAKSYFDAKTAGTLAKHHGGAGPRAVALIRNNYNALFQFEVKPGAYLTPLYPWNSGDILATSNWGLWWGIGAHDRLTLSAGYIIGGAVRVTCDTPLNYPILGGTAWTGTCSGTCAYDSLGQVCLPLTPEMLVSA